MRASSDKTHTKITITINSGGRHHVLQQDPVQRPAQGTQTEVRVIGGFGFYFFPSTLTRRLSPFSRFTIIFSCLTLVLTPRFAVTTAVVLVLSFDAIRHATNAGD